MKQPKIKNMKDFVEFYNFQKQQTLKSIDNNNILMSSLKKYEDSQTVKKQYYK